MNGKNAFMFLLGAAVGAVGAYFYTKQKYEDIIDEEVESVKQMYADKKEPNMAKTDSDDPEIVDEKVHSNDSAVTAYHKIAGDYNHSHTKRKGPRVISEEEFGEEDLSVTFTYYADGVITDEMDIIVDDADEAIGTEFVSAFDDDTCEVVYVRNEVRHCDYEIIRERERYADTHPVIMEDI